MEWNSHQFYTLYTPVSAHQHPAADIQHMNVKNPIDMFHWEIYQILHFQELPDI